MTIDGRLSRRDFLRLRKTDRGKALELSCRAWFMRWADASIDADPPAEHEPWMGEPEAVMHRRSQEDLLQSLEQELRDVQVLRLLEPEWLANIDASGRVDAVIAAFRARGGVVE